MKVLFYGRLAESIASQVEVNVLPGGTVAKLREQLIAAYPQAQDVLRSRRSRACIRDTLVNDDHVLEAAEMVEFLPPVSGG